MANETIEVLRIPGTLFPRGPFDENADYKFLNFVESGGNGYVCLQPCTGIPVTNTAYWFKFVFKGEKGDAFTYADLTAAQKAELVQDATAAAQAAGASAQQAAASAEAANQKFATIKAAIDAIDPTSTEGSIQTLAAKQGLLEAGLDELGLKLGEGVKQELIIEQGGLDAGVDIAKTDRIRTRNYIQYPSFRIKITSGGCYAYGYNDNGYVANSGWHTEESTVSISGATKYRLIFKNDNGTSISPSDFQNLGVEVYGLDTSKKKVVTKDEVVNNLFSGGVDVPLSSEQGKIVNRTAQKTVLIDEEIGIGTIVIDDLVNGTRSNPSNANCIRTNKIPVVVGKTYRFVTNRPPTNGYSYDFGITTFSSNDSSIDSNTVRTIAISASTPNESVITINEGEVALIYDIGEHSGSTRNPIRVSSFADYVAGVNEYSKESLRQKMDSLSTSTAEIKKKIDGESVNSPRYADYIYRQLTTGYSPYDVQNGIRLRIIFKVESGAHLSISSSWATGIYVGVWSSVAWAAIAGSNGRLQQINTTYSTDVVDADITANGYLCISLKNNDDSAISDADKENMLNSITMNLIMSVGLVDEVSKLKKRKESSLVAFPLPLFVAGHVVESGVAAISTADKTRATINSLVVLPNEGTQFKVRMSGDYLLGIRFYNGYTNVGAVYGGKWLTDEDILNIPSGYSHFHAYLCHTSDGASADNAFTFTDDVLADINNMVADGKIALLYEGSTIKERLVANGHIKSTIVRYTSDKSLNMPEVMPTFVHISDVHGDAIRFHNAIAVANHFKVTALIHTGDSVAYDVINGIGFLAEVDDAEIPVISAIGNHDANGDSTYISNLNDNLYNNCIKPFEEVSGYSLPSQLQYNDAPTYYYKDFASEKIRVIVLNLYDYGLINWTYNVLSQRQIDWLIETLASTPAEYGVLVAYHRSAGGVEKDSSHDKFWQESSTAGYHPSTWSMNGITGNPILDIVDAFISKTTLQTTFSQMITGGETETISIDADFTSVNNGVEFVAHLFGHHHRDTVGYYMSEQKQLCLCVCQTTSAYSSAYTSWANPSDLPRFGGGKEQDAFNIYTIDRNAKSVRIAKFGSTLSSETLKERDFMVIPYANV